MQLWSYFCSFQGQYFNVKKFQGSRRRSRSFLKQKVDEEEFFQKVEQEKVEVEEFFIKKKWRWMIFFNV